MRQPAAIVTTAATWAVMAAVLAAPAATADTVDLGSTTDVDLVDIENGADVEIEQNWTISDLRPSSDSITYPLAGTLWEATATIDLDQGGVPVIPGFFASANGQAYPVLWTVASPAGVNPGALPPGGSATGKLYFDVTGAAPTSVAVQDADDLVSWQTPGG